MVRRKEPEKRVAKIGTEKRSGRASYPALAA